MRYASSSEGMYAELKQKSEPRELMAFAAAHGRLHHVSPAFSTCTVLKPVGFPSGPMSPVPFAVKKKAETA